MEFRFQKKVWKNVSIMLAVVLMVAIGLLLAGCGSEGNVEASGTGNGGLPDSQDAEKASDTTVFVLTGENFKFVLDGQDNPDIRVKKGDTITIEFTSIQGFHDWVVDELSAATKQVRPEDGMASVTFTAGQIGTFEYYCSVGSHRDLGMKGRLIVE